MKNTSALLFINGEPPEQFPELQNFGTFCCTDGAFHYLKENNFPLEKLDFISGDFDSHSGKDTEIFEEKFIFTPDQNKTDFEKALEILIQKGTEKVSVYGGSGGEMDHFLGNLTVAYKFQKNLEIKFYDNFSEYFFIPNHFTVKHALGKLISLYPFPFAENITTTGLNWPLERENLTITDRIGTRNFAVKDEVNIQYEKGSLLIFIGEQYL